VATSVVLSVPHGRGCTFKIRTFIIIIIIIIIISQYPRLCILIRSEVIRKELEIPGIQDVRSKYKQNWINHLERMDNTRLKEEEIVDAPGNDGNASMSEQFKRPKPWRKMMIIIIIIIITFNFSFTNVSVEQYSANFITSTKYTKLTHMLDLLQDQKSF
jgi:hypothetical protein